MPQPSPRAVIFALVVSGVGHIIHNLAEFPIAILVGWETVLPIGVTVLLGAIWYLRPGRATFAMLAVWAAVVIVFGGGSVIPFGFLPFVPEQSISHYVAHAVYALTQIPLLWIGLQGTRPTNPGIGGTPVK